MKYGDYKRYDALAEEKKKALDDIEHRISKIDDETKALMFPLRFWRYRRHAELSNEKRDLEEKHYATKKEISELEKKRFKNARRLVIEAKDFLTQQGFIPAVSSYDDNKNITTETWARTEL